MNTKFEVIDYSGQTISLYPRLELYTVHDFMGQELPGIAIALDFTDPETGKLEQYAILTKSFGEPIGLKNSAYIDTNNCYFAQQLLEQGMANVSERLENTGRVTGAFEIDFDRGICSALDIMDGWKAYPIKDVCAAAFQAYRKGHATEQERWQKFLDRLDGRELTAADVPSEDAPFYEQPEPSLRGL